MALAINIGAFSRIFHELHHMTVNSSAMVCCIKLFKRIHCRKRSLLKQNFTFVEQYVFYDSKFIVQQWWNRFNGKGKISYEIWNYNTNRNSVYLWSRARLAINKKQKYFSLPDHQLTEALVLVFGFYEKTKQE